MFKSVKYYNLDASPGLRERVEKVMPIVEDELQTAADRTTITWNYRPDVLELLIKDELFGEPTLQYLNPKRFDFDEREFRENLRFAHREAAMDFLRKQVETMKQSWPTSTGA